MMKVKTLSMSELCLGIESVYLVFHSNCSSFRMSSIWNKRRHIYRFWLELEQLVITYKDILDFHANQKGIRLPDKLNSLQMHETHEDCFIVLGCTCYIQMPERRKHLNNEING